MVAVPCRLSRTQIGTDNLRIGPFVAHLNCPDTCPSPQVKDPSSHFPKGCIVKSVAHRYPYHLMYEVEVVLFALKVGLGDRTLVFCDGR